MSGPIVTVSQGQLQGKTVQTASGKEYHSFQGIPYAKPPIGSLRFKAPQPAEPWEGIREATAEGNICAQVDTVMKETNEFEGGEDCLFVNVYTPFLDGREKTPVMVWIHGGCFQFGSGNADQYGPDNFVEKDVVVVTLNYRLNILGFLCLNTPDAPGNAGLKDQALALKWIKENISNFGGDESNITVFGESAGGASVSYLAVSPSTKNLFNKAALQSGTFLNCWSYLTWDPVESAKEIAKDLGHASEDIDELFAFLQTAPVKELVETVKKADKLLPKFAPVVEKEFSDIESFLTESPLDILTSGGFAKVPVLIGNTSLEGGVDLVGLHSIEGPDKEIRNHIPIDLNIDFNSETAVEVADQIKHFYFGEAEVGVETLKQYLDLKGDIYFTTDIRKFIDLLEETTEQPVFEYRFSYYGALNLFKKLLDTFGVKGACHGDELGYQFAVAAHKDVDVTSQDVLTRDVMIELWTNFAKFGNPTPGESELISTKWLPVTKDDKYYLDINTELSLSTNQNAKNVEFWSSIYTKYAQPASAVTKSNNTDDVSVTAVVIEEQLVQVADAQESEVQSTPEVQQELEEQNASEVQVVPEVQQETEVKDEPEVQDVPEVQQETEVQNIVEIQAPEVKVAEEHDEIKSDEAILEVDDLVNISSSPTVEEQVPVAKVEDTPVIIETVPTKPQNGFSEQNGVNVVKGGTQMNGNGPKADVIRANDPPEDDLPKNIGVNKFVNFFESLGGKKVE